MESNAWYRRKWSIPLAVLRFLGDSNVRWQPLAMPKFYKPDLGANPDDPFARDENDKLVRRSFWLDMNDRSLVLVMTADIGADLANEQKRAHLAELNCEHLVDEVCIYEILPPED